MIHKTTPSLDYNLWLKRSETQLNELTNKNSIKVSKVTGPTNKNRYDKILWTSLINMPMSPPSLYYNALVRDPRNYYQRSEHHNLILFRSSATLLSNLVFNFPVSTRKRLISDGLEPVLSHTEKLCKASYCIQFLLL